MASTILPPEMAISGAAEGGRPLSIEELCFTSAMSCFEGWLKLDPAIGPRTMAYVTKFISKTLEKTHNLKDVRYDELFLLFFCYYSDVVQGNTI